MVKSPKDKKCSAEGISTVEQMQRAVEAVESGAMSLRQAAASFSISKSALHRRTSGQVDLNAKRGPNPVLTDGEVHGVLDAVIARTAQGQCFTSEELGLFVRTVVEQSQHAREIPINFPSPSWVCGFIRRHSHLFARRRAQSLDVCRAAASTEENILKHFNNLQSTMKTCGDLSPSRIWNLDETGMCGQGSRNQKVVLAAKGQRANTQQSNSRTNVSALVCVNADGHCLPPFFIFPGKNVIKAHTAGASPGTLFAATESSFLVTALFVQYFEWFVRQIPTYRPVLVIMDGYKAHFSMRTIAHARSHGILLYALPAHTSHFLQPLDVSVFQHFKRELDNEIDHFQKSSLMMAEKSNIVGIASRALDRSVTRSRIVDGFEKTGIYPLSRSKMLEGIIGDKPCESRRVILLAPAVAVTDRTKRKIEREGDSVDRVIVASINHWMLERRKERKRHRPDASSDYVHGGCLMTSDEMVAVIEQRAADKRLKDEEKERKRMERIQKKVSRDAKAAQAAHDKAATQLAKAAAKAAKVQAASQAKREREAVKATARQQKQVAEAAKARQREEKRAAKAQSKGRPLRNEPESAQPALSTDNDEMWSMLTSFGSEPPVLKSQPYGEDHTNSEYTISL